MAHSRLAIFSMQKNERNLSQTWFEYYSKLIPVNDIHIIDNDSDAESSEVLGDIGKRGAHVRTMAGQQSFMQKGRVLLSWALERAVVKKYDFLYFADADEFLCARTPGNRIAPEKQDIYDELDRLYFSKNDIFRIRDCVNNIPGTTLGYRSTLNKVLLKYHPSLQSLRLDQGFHLLDNKTRKDNCSSGHIELSNLGFLHMHNKSYEWIVQSSREKLRPYVDVNNIEELKNYSGTNSRAVQNILQSKNEYLESFKRFQSVCFDISDIFKINGVAFPAGYL